MIHFVVGTRAQLFKMAPIMIECNRRQLEWRWIYTAQHKDTIQPTLAMFNLPEPDFIVINWNTEAKTFGKMARWLVLMIASLLKSKKILAGKTGKKHVVLTHGDTFSTWFGALYGRITRTRVMHVESGLRSFNIFRPFPEEINRLMTFSLSDYYACPGEWAMQNLKKYNGEKLDTHENTQIDTVRFGMENYQKADIAMPQNPYVVASIHRYENIFNKKRFNKILEEIEQIAEKFTVYLVQHPATFVQIDKLGFRERLQSNQQIVLLPRLEYLHFIKLVMNSEFVITDGGGNQEELYHLGKPTLLFRDETERQEGIGTTAVISKMDSAVIKDFVNNYRRYEQPPVFSVLSPSAMIVDFLQNRGHG